MDWTEVNVSTTTQGADIVSAALINLGAKGTQIVDRADVPDPTQPHGYWELIDQELIDSMPEDVHVKAWFQSYKIPLSLMETLRQLPLLSGMDLGTLDVSSDTAKEKDWTEYWKRFYKPFRIGKRFVVKPGWETYAAAPQDLVIELDPGMAFGTGSHETTALCLELMEKYYLGGRMLDIGTGSGILAIAAARLGAEKITAVDVDPLAVRVAAENVSSNGLDEIIFVRQGDLTKGLNEKYDFAVANILADVILMLLQPLKDHVVNNGVCVFSGILLDKKEGVLEGLQSAGYITLEIRERGDWCAIAAKMA
ncbi:MAG: 50S ribosomal protein L11 methyltransferase [Eubacteriales bacterium]|jgi:ribosomal protein L11 methyltransferase|nr:50S ribosomal protein L11 methyltransferase [Eubacteriales bacterium]MDD4104801.1 50S ribosomal protein L11 methyltransferase [Eubacteriales bacterium]